MTPEQHAEIERIAVECYRAYAATFRANGVTERSAWARWRAMHEDHRDQWRSVARYALTLWRRVPVDSPQPAKVGE